MKTIGDILYWLFFAACIILTISLYIHSGILMASGWIVACIALIFIWLLIKTGEYQSKLIKDLSDLTDSLTKEFLKNQKRV